VTSNDIHRAIDSQFPQKIPILLGPLRQAVEEAIREASSCVATCSFRDSYGMFAAEKESTEVRVTLAPNPRPQAQDRKMVFVAFTSRYDAERHRHEPYYPLRFSSRN
jgi:hypothetical protein